MHLDLAWDALARHLHIDLARHLFTLFASPDLPSPHTRARDPPISHGKIVLEYALQSIFLTRFYRGGVCSSGTALSARSFGDHTPPIGGVIPSLPRYEGCALGAHPAVSRLTPLFGCSVKLIRRVERSDTMNINWAGQPKSGGRSTAYEVDGSWRSR